MNYLMLVIISNYAATAVSFFSLLWLLHVASITSWLKYLLYLGQVV